MASIYSLAGQLVYDEDALPGARRSDSYFYLGGRLIAQKMWHWDTNQTTVEFRHADYQGTRMADSGSAGQVLRRQFWQPYGQPVNNPAFDGLGYTRHKVDAVTGLIYMQQRYYDPGIGRFLSVDPVTASSITGANFNRYWYASDNPHKNTDPDGRCDGPSTCRIEWEEKAVMRGEMSQAQKTANDQARGWGAVAGIAIVVTRNPMAVFRAFSSVLKRDAGHTIPKDKAPHIFREKEGHLKDTPQNRETLQRAADDPKTTLGPDRHGNTCSAQQNKNGSQTWTQTRNGEIRNAGVNKTPKQYNPETGLSRPVRPDKERQQ